jgi:diguanylate cyclase (GGDEF)-like protein
VAQQWSGTARKWWAAKFEALSVGVGIPWLLMMLVGAAWAAAALPHPEVGQDTGAPVKLAFAKIGQEGASAPTFEQALGALRGAKTSWEGSTNLSESYFAFEGVASQAGTLFLTSRHVVELDCWSKDVKDALGPRRGSAGYGGETGALRPFAQGFAMEVGRGEGFVCVQKSTGPAKIAAVSMTPTQAQVFQGAFEWRRGALLAGVGTLVLFMGLAGVVNKDWRYAVFGLWLVMGLRVAQISQGTDTSLLGFGLALEWMPGIRMVSIAAYVALQLMLFKTLLGKDEAKLGSKMQQWTAATGAGSMALMLAALALPFRWYLPVMWLAVVNAIVNMASRLVILISRKETRSETAIWCALGLAVPMLSWASEVVSAALGLSNAVRWLNNENAALLSSLMVAMAFAQQLKDERREKVKAQEELRKAYSTSPMGLFEADEAGFVVQANPAMREMLGEKDAAGWSMEQKLRARAWKDLAERALRCGGPVDATLEAVDARQGQRWFDVRAQASAAGTIEGSMQDATERVLQKARLEFLASHDPLTECLNLRGLEHLLDEVDKEGRTEALVGYFDLDRFKLINDVYGHEAGDTVLREVKRRMQTALGPGASLGRVGGDEFLVLFDGVDMDNAQRRCEQVLLDLSKEPFAHEGKSFKLSVSCGLVQASAIGAANARALIGAADSACRMAKSQGRAQLVAYGRGSMFFERRMESFEIAKMFEGDGVPEGLYLLGQPIMSLSSPFDSLNFEVLLRMRFPDGRMVGAGPLIETAEAHGHIAKLDLWVLTSVLDWIGAHRRELAHTRFICVNLSGGSLNDETFLDKAFALLEQRKAEAAYLCVEITESVALRDLDNIRLFVERARSLGARVALDDFGAGYSSFGYLKDLPADALKIDGALARDAMDNPASQSILVALSGLATALGMRSIGEWAENCEMVKMLALSSFDYAQGYAVAKPMPLDELIQAKSCGDLIEDPDTALYARLLQSGGGMEFSFEQETRYLH